MKNSSGLQLEIQRQAKIELGRRCFWDFCLWYDDAFFSKRLFLKKIADAFQLIYEGKIHKLSVSMPPRAGKSYITTLYAAWMLGKRPTESIMRNTCTATLYDKFSYDTRNVVRSQKYKDVFPEAILSPDRQNINGWNLVTSRQVAYFGAGVGGTIIGFGASLLAITDDLYRGLADALSEGTNEKVQQWKEAAHDSRVEQNSEGMECPEIDIGTRWSQNDVIGRGITNGKYDLSLVIPALDEHGNTFCEAVHSTAFYQEKRDSLEPEVWDSEYMQQPIEVKGLLFPESSLKRFNEVDLRKEDATSIMGYIDVADEGTDYFAMAIGYVFKNAVYITDVIFTPENTDITTPLVVELINEQTIYETIMVDEKPKQIVKKELDWVRVESNNQGSVVRKDYAKLVEPTKILGVTNSTNKHSRIYLAAPFIKKYFYFKAKAEIEKGGHYAKFLEALAKYMKDGSYKKDDAPDCLSGLQKFVKACWGQDLFSPVAPENEDGGA